MPLGDVVVSVFPGLVNSESVPREAYLLLLFTLDIMRAVCLFDSLHLKNKVWQHSETVGSEGALRGY